MDSNSNDLTPEELLKIVQPYFIHEWQKCKPEDIAVKILVGGFCNSISVVTRNNATKDDIEPHSVIVKKKEGLINVDGFNLSNPRLIAIIAYEMAKKGLGPKIYGISQFGSVEEYIPSHTLTPSEAENENIFKDIAIQLANVHAIQGLPLKKDVLRSSILSDYQNFIDNSDKHSKSEAFKKHNMNMQQILDWNVAQENEWLQKFVQLGRFRSNFILYDMNYMNCLVRDDKKDDSSVMLIDYDLAHYNLRGIDLGVHFLNKMFQYSSNPVIIPGGKELCESDKRKFLTTYQQTIKKLNLWSEFDENAIDSVDNLLLESKVGQLIYYLQAGTYLLANFETMGDPVGCLIPAFINNYHKIKSELMQ